MLGNLLRSVLAWLARRLFSLRYRLEVRGLDEIRQRGTRGVLFLPSHLALIDPAILMVLLDRGFRPRALADQYQVTRPIVGPVARLFGVRVLPNMERQGLSVLEATRRALEETVAGLRRGENLLFYPAGRLRQQRLEELRAASGAEVLIRAVPQARVVLVRQTGLWGSRFSLAFDGRMPQAVPTLLRGLKDLLLSGIFFMPRRHVLIEFVEPDDVPRDAGRMALNRYLEQFYNARAPRNTYVPYRIWERGGVQERPDPEVRRITGDASRVPEATRRIVFDELERLSGATSIRLTDRLAQDLGFDSLAVAELLLWIEQEFGFSGGTPESLITVGDVVLTAAGQGVSIIESELRSASSRWLAPGEGERIRVPAGETITEVFLARAARHPDRVVLADQTSGEVTYRRLILGLFLLVPAIRALPGSHIGIMLPASVGAGLLYLAVLFAGKTPVMVNWTTGTRNLMHSLDLLGVRHVVTARALVARLETLGIDLSDLAARFVLVEDLRARMTAGQKLLALVRSRVSWRALGRTAPTDTAVVLFTSGSENLPKAVPLTHANVLANIRDVLAVVPLDDRDVLIGMLPPFHSFGITVTTILPLCAGLRTVYHPNPTEAAVLARLVASYRVTMLVGTPTFLHGIVRAGTREQLASLRLAVTGAEKCSETVYQALRVRCPDATILEGYGITECAPIVSVNHPDSPVAGSIGRLLPSVAGTIVDVESGETVSHGRTGMLLVRGPSIFAGYLHHQGESVFVDHDGCRWYRTGDLVRREADGTLFFEGRLKRFVKIGGEMISLPAIEAVLLPHVASDDDAGPVVAVDAIESGDAPEIVLFTSRPVARERVNQWLRDAGLGPLSHVRRVVSVEAIPVLGTGKTDYRGLRERCAASNEA